MRDITKERLRKLCGDLRGKIEEARACIFDEGKGINSILSQHVPAYNQADHSQPGYPAEYMDKFGNNTGSIYMNLFLVQESLNQPELTDGEKDTVVRALGMLAVWPTTVSDKPKTEDETCPQGMARTIGDLERYIETHRAEIPAEKHVTLQEQVLKLRTALAVIPKFSKEAADIQNIIGEQDKPIA